MKRKTETETEEHPQKRFKFLAKDKYTRFPIRTRAHANPLSDEAFEYPLSPHFMDWNSMYPKLVEEKSDSSFTPFATILDVGCAYAGLLVRLAPLHPDKIMLGMEIRPRVVEYSQNRIEDLRQNENIGHNIWVIRCNVMKNLVQYIKKSQLERIFFCYPDPHWKKKKHRRRIITQTLLDEYAFVLKKGGFIYAVSDEKELGDWMRTCLENHPLFVKLTNEEIQNDPFVPFVRDSSEDAQRTERQKKDKHLCVFKRI